MTGVALASRAAALTVAVQLTATVARAEPGAAVPDPPTEYLIHEESGFHVAYHPGTRERVRAVLPRLARIRSDLRAAVGADVLGEVHIRVVPRPNDLALVAPEGATIESGGGVSAEARLVVVSGDAGTRGGALERTLRHHLAHLAVDEAAGGPELPTWFREGFATHFAGDDTLARVQRLEKDVFFATPPNLAAFDDAAPDRRSALAADFVRFTGREPNRVPALLAGLRAGRSFDQALTGAFGSSVAQIDRSWKEDVARRHAVLPVLLLGLVLWLALLVVARLRRRAPPVTEDRPSARPRRVRARANRPRALAVEVVRVDAARPSTPPGQDPSAAVPQVEHDGNWHTLH